MEPIDLLINNAGVLPRTESISVSSEEMHSAFHVNAIAPLLIIQKLHSRLLLASHPLVINLTSRVGSIADNSSGGIIAYRSSKTALNMITKTLAIEMPQITFLALHPGYIKTGMTNNTGDMEPEETVDRMLKIVAKADKSMTGQFIHRDDYILPW
jgi:NAD(P)-dependent dehydrogenase (short-subunit alcohol dehydrogenase family)